MKKKAILFLLILAPILAAGLVSIHLTMIAFTPYSGEPQIFQVKPGEGFSSINARLSQANIIPDARMFHYYTKYKDSMNKMKAGSYEIKSGQTMFDILDTLVDGVPILNAVTIPEGKNMYEIGKILESKGITTYEEFIKECRNQETIRNLGIKAPSVEGYLFPETYKFAPKSPAKFVVTTFLNQFKRATSNLDLTESGLTTHETVILASIVEKETGAKVERPTIAGVYHNRLKKRMRLQADPTTIYGIWETYNGNLRKKHLLQKTAYNTYKMSGLPLGPISNPSLAAIKATMNPEQHNNLYFVSKNDGTHIFTPTYKDHLKAVDFWQKNRKNRQGKSWRDLKQ